MKKILLILALCISFLYAEDFKKVSLQLKWKHQFQFAGFIAAYEKGFYKDLGIDVQLEEIQENIDVVDNVLSGKSDFAISDSSLIYEALKGKQVTAMMAIFQDSPYILMGLKEKNIHTLDDLNGKEIALYDGIFGISIKAMLKTKNINYIIKPPIFNMEQLLLSDVDMMSAYISNEPYMAKQSKLDIMTFRPKDYGFEGYGDILFTSKLMNKSNPELVKKFYEASEKGWKYAFEHKDELVDIIYNKYNTLNKSKDALLYEANILHGLSTYKNNFGQLNIEKVKSIAQQFNLVKNEHNLLSSLDDFIYSKNIKADSSIRLTEDERSYLLNHNTLTVQNEKDWMPYNYIEEGKAKGFSIDYINLLAKKLNIKIEYISGETWSGFLHLLKNNEIDIISNIVKNKKREDYISFTTPYMNSKKAIFSNVNNIKSISDLNGKTVAVPEEFYTQDYLQEYYPNINIKTYRNSKEALYAVVSKEADAIIENFAVIDSLMKKNGLKIPYISLNDDELKSELRIGVNKNNTILRDILEKAKATVTDEEFLKLEMKWFGVEKNTDLVFSTKEIEYIKHKRVVNVCYHQEQHPWAMKIDNKVKGFSFEFLKKISTKSKLQFNMIETLNVEEHFKNIREGVCDISPIIVTHPNKFDFLNPTVSIVEDNIVLVTKINEPYISDLTQVKNKKIAIHKGKASFIRYVKSIYPNIDIEEIDKLDLKDIVNGKYYGYISNSYKMSYKIYPRYVNQIKIMSKVGQKKLSGSLGVTTREPVLLSILNKSIKDITRLERQEIENAWVSVEVEKQFDYILFLQIFAVLTIIVIILLISNLKQKKLKEKIQLLNNNLEQRVREEVEKNREKDKLMLSQSRLAQMGEIISMIAHQWRQPLNSLSLLNQTVLLKYDRGKLNDETIEFFKIHSKKQIKEMSKTIDDFRDFFKPEKIKTQFSLKQMIKDTITLVNPIFISNNIRISFDIKEEYNVLGYENELGQAILNIINNAKDILIENTIDDKKISISITKMKDDIFINICDNAGGIPKEIIDNIFDPYFSTKEEKNGTGLGLYMTKMIIEEHMQGKVSVKNNQDGAEFEIILQNNVKDEAERENI